jgi:hypothetical protein
VALVDGELAAVLSGDRSIPEKQSDISERFSNSALIEIPASFMTRGRMDWRLSRLLGPWLLNRLQ